MSVLQLKGIKKSFGTVEIIHGIDLDVHDGEFLVFVAPSGCGKSTMLRMIAGLETISSGELLIDGKTMNDAAPVERRVAMVFQNYALYPNMSVWQNMAFGLQQARLPKDQIRQSVLEAARTLKIEELLQRRPNQLSGGQSQRVAIGRAIVRNPDLFLFDEPLSNLDAELRIHMRVELGRLHQRLGRTVIYVTHDQVEAMTMADRIVVINHGRVEQTGTPLDLYNKPANLFVAGFIGSPRMNFLTGDLITEGGGAHIDALGRRLRLPVRPDGGDGTAITLGVRPEHVEVVEPGQGNVDAEATLIEQLGSETLIHCTLNGENTNWVVKTMGQVSMARRQAVSLRISWAHAKFFLSNEGSVVSTTGSQTLS